MNSALVSHSSPRLHDLLEPLGQSAHAGRLLPGAQVQCAIVSSSQKKSSSVSLRTGFQIFSSISRGFRKSLQYVEPSAPRSIHTADQTFKTFQRLVAAHDAVRRARAERGRAVLPIGRLHAVLWSAGKSFFSFFMILTANRLGCRGKKAVML